VVVNTIDTLQRPFRPPLEFAAKDASLNEERRYRIEQNIVLEIAQLRSSDKNADFVDDCQGSPDLFHSQEADQGDLSRVSPVAQCWCAR
jgi:hypothetical protein